MLEVVDVSKRLPIVSLLFVVLAPLWTMATAAKAVALLTLAGVLLVECLLFGWRKVPFASGHTPSADALEKTWPIYLWALYVFAFKLSDWQDRRAHVAARAPRVCDSVRRRRSAAAYAAQREAGAEPQRVRRYGR